MGAGVEEFKNDIEGLLFAVLLESEVGLFAGNLFLNFSKKGKRTDSGEVADCAADVKDTDCVGVDKDWSNGDGVLVILVATGCDGNSD